MAIMLVMYDFCIEEDTEKKLKVGRENVSFSVFLNYLFRLRFLLFGEKYRLTYPIYLESFILILLSFTIPLFNKL